MASNTYIYNAGKKIITQAIDSLSTMNESSIKQFLLKHGNPLQKKYYSAKVGEGVNFYASPSNVATYFKYNDYQTQLGPSNIKDPVRRLSGLYWTQSEVQADLKVDLTTSTHVAYFRSVVDEDYIPMSVNFTSLRGTSEGALVAEEWVLLSTNNKRLDESIKYHDLIKSEINNKVFEDFTFSTPRYYNQKDIEKKYESVLTNMVNIEGDYNYFDRTYETTAANALVHEATLPNMYIFFAYQEQLQDAQNPAYDSLLTLNQKLNINNHQDMFAASGKESGQKRITPTERYFKKWSQAYSQLSSQEIADLSKKFENIHLSIEDVKSFQSYGGRKELFPMWMNIEFTTDRIVEFAETLKETQIMGILQSSLMEAVRAGALTDETFFTAYVERNNATRPELPEEGIMKQYHSQSVDVSYFDMTQWVNNFVESGSFSVDSLYATFLGTLDESVRISDDPKYNFFKSLMAIILKGKIRKLLRKHTRTMQEVFSGKQCYSETIMYRVEKYDGAGSSGVPLQTIYVPNSHELDKFQYIDTQVKYAKEYTYVVYAYQIVVGNKYQYVDSDYAPQAGGWAALLVKNEPALRLYETEIYRHTNRVLDNPPISPEVEFVPYKGVNDKVKIIMNSGIGRYTLPYEVIEFEEQDQIDKIKLAQNRKPSETSLRYETDDHPAFYEVRRMTSKPKSYRDFAGKLVHQISTVADGLEASGIGIDDSIKPNSKYYYCVRAVDYHGHVSYPSPIYEVEMVDDKGSVYPIIKICEFDEEIKSQTSIGAKRYIRIKPSMPQTILNEEASGLVDAESVADVTDVTLGIADESVWNKKFKIRLVSKSTGRKIDFNVKFTHKHNKLNEDN